MSRTCRIRAVVSFILGFSFVAEALAEEVVFQEKGARGWQSSIFKRLEIDFSL